MMTSIDWPALCLPPINLYNVPNMTKIVYGHVPPFQGLDEAFDKDMAAIQEAKEAATQKLRDDFKAKCQAVHDAVNRPNHYTFGSIECIDYIKDVLTKEEYIGYLRGCMIKYQHRLRGKGDSAENAGKMNWYNDRLIKELKE